jgi:hypothetical protein
MGRKNKGGKELAQPKDQTPLLPLSGSRKVVRTPTNPFEAAGTIEVFVPKEIIARRIQQIFAGPNKGRKADHYLVVWEDYPLEKDYTWEPIENLYGHEDLAQTYEQWLKTENERLDSVEAERKTARKMTAQKVQDVAADQFRKNDKFTKKAKGTDNTSRQTLHQEVEQDEAEAAADEDVNNGCDDEVSTGSEGVSEGVGEKRTRGRDRKARHLKSVVYTSNSFVAIRDKQQNVVQAKCCIMLESTGKACGMTVEIPQSSPKPCWNHLQKHHKTEFLALKMAQVHNNSVQYVHALVYVRIVY